MSLTTQCLRTLRQPSRAAIGLPALSYRLSGSKPHSNFKIAPTQRRAFSLASVLDTSQDLILGLHHVTGTPWYITIPMVAIGVTAVFRLPFQIYTQKVVQQRRKYDPLILALNAKALLDVAKEQRYTKREAIKIATKRSKKKEKQLFRKAGLQQWKIISSALVSTPAWLIAIDSIRRLAGGPRGLAGYFAMDEQVREAGLEWHDLAQSANNELPGAAAEIDFSATASSAADGLIFSFEPSLMTEGCLWFTNLAAADPYHILPFLLSATLVANALPKTDAARRNLFGLNPKASKSDTTTVYTTSPMRRGFSRSYLILSAAIGPLTMSLPAAIHLYWLSSTLAGYLTRYLIDKRWPVAKEQMVKPCTSIKESAFVRPTGESDDSGNIKRVARPVSKAAR